MTDDVDALAWLSVLYEIAGDEKAATAAATELARDLPPAAALALQSSLFSSLGHGERALTLATAAIAADPGTVSGLSGLGSAYERWTTRRRRSAAYEQATLAAEQSGDQPAVAGDLPACALAYLLQRGAGSNRAPAATP